MQGLSSPARDRTRVPCFGRRILNHCQGSPLNVTFVKVKTFPHLTKVYADHWGDSERWALLPGFRGCFSCCVFGLVAKGPLWWIYTLNCHHGALAAVHGVAKGWTQLNVFTFTFHFHALEKAMAPHSRTLAWKIQWTEEPGGLQSMGSLRVRHDWATSLSLLTFMHWRRKWQPTPVF